MDLTRVFVYFNLHKKVFSVKDRRTGLVVAHSPTVHLSASEFRVQEGGRQRVIREQRKNVHAGVCGQVLELSGEVIEVVDFDAIEITYNPYKHSSFVTLQEQIPVYSAHRVVLSGKRVWAWEINPRLDR